MEDGDRFMFGERLRDGVDFLVASAEPGFFRRLPRRRDVLLLGCDQRREPGRERDRDEKEERAAGHHVRVYDGDEGPEACINPQALKSSSPQNIGRHVKNITATKPCSIPNRTIQAVR